MIDDRDPLLTRLFAEQSQPAQGSEFVAQLINHLERDQRNWRRYRTGIIVAGVIGAALLAPWIAQVAAMALGSIAAGIIATGSLLYFPMAWLAVCSMVATFLPIVYLGITRRW